MSESRRRHSAGTARPETARNTLYSSAVSGSIRTAASAAVMRSKLSPRSCPDTGAGEGSGAGHRRRHRTARAAAQKGRRASRVKPQSTRGRFRRTQTTDRDPSGYASTWAGGQRLLTSRIRALDSATWPSRLKFVITSPLADSALTARARKRGRDREYEAALALAARRERPRVVRCARICAARTTSSSIARTSERCDLDPSGVHRGASASTHVRAARERRRAAGRTSARTAHVCARWAVRARGAVAALG